MDNTDTTNANEFEYETAASLSDIDWRKLGEALRENATEAFGATMPPLDSAYTFLLDNPECFGYEEWPADMPQTAPEELQRAYGMVTEPSSEYWRGLSTASESDAPEVNYLRLSLSDIEELLTLNSLFDNMLVNAANVPTEIQSLVHTAWYITEEKIREATGYCSSQATLKEIHRPQAAPFTCQCCRYFNSIRHRVERIRRYL